MDRTADETLAYPSCAECQSIGIAMPDILVRLEDAVGAEVLLPFLLDRGGREFGVPVRPGGDDPHSAVTAWLRNEFGWGRLTIPRGPITHQARLAWTIYLWLRAERSLSEIARALNIHIRTVCNHKSRLTARGLLAAPGAKTQKDVPHDPQ